MGNAFNECRALQGSLSRFGPPLIAASIQTRVCKVMRQQFRFGCSVGGELVAKDLAHAAVQNLAPALEQILISRILNERVLEAIIGSRREALHQQDVGFGEPLQSRS